MTLLRAQYTILTKMVNYLKMKSLSLYTNGILLLSKIAKILNYGFN